MNPRFVPQVAESADGARTNAATRTARSRVAGCEALDRGPCEAADRRKLTSLGRILLSSILAVACATGVDPEGRGGGNLDGGSGSSGFGGSAAGNGGSAGVLGTSGANGSGGSAAFGAGGNLGASGTTGSGGSGGTSFGGTLGSGGTSAAGGTGGAAGSGGVSGSGGSVGSGGSGGTAPIKPCMAAVADAGTGVVKLQMRNNEDSSPTNPEIKPIYNLVNLTGAAIPLTELKVRYWYTKEPSASTQNLVCDYAVIGNTNLDVGNDTAVALDAAKPGASWYFELRFTGGSLPANGQTGDIKLRFHTEPFENMSEVDDYSYCQATTLTDWDHVTVYRGSALVWGLEP